MLKSWKIPLVCVVGPTASGKTSFAIDIAEAFGGEIISLDSMQIYKYLDIGTAKPTEEEQKRAVHRLIGIADPLLPYSVNDYVQDASREIEDTDKRGKLPILCGGTGLYLDSLLFSFNMSEAGTDEGIREKYFRIAEENSNEYLHSLLEKVDPKSAAEIHPNNVKRVVRALEIYELTGKPRSEQLTKEENQLYQPLIFAMERDRDELYSRIDKRVDIMIEQGLENEVRTLVSSGILPKDISSQASQAIGYREMIMYLNGEISFDEAVDLIKMNSRRYAKRQLTWFRRNEKIIRINPDDIESKAAAFDLIKQMLEQ